jgi:hypothetical protein
MSQSTAIRMARILTQSVWPGSSGGADDAQHERAAGAHHERQRVLVAADEKTTGGQLTTRARFSAGPVDTHTEGGETPGVSAGAADP